MNLLILGVGKTAILVYIRYKNLSNIQSFEYNYLSFQARRGPIK